MRAVCSLRLPSTGDKLYRVTGINGATPFSSNFYVYRNIRIYTVPSITVL